MGTAPPSSTCSFAADCGYVPPACVAPAVDADPNLEVGEESRQAGGEAGSGEGGEAGGGDGGEAECKQEDVDAEQEDVDADVAAGSLSVNLTAGESVA